MDAKRDETSTPAATDGGAPRLVRVDSLRPEGYDGTCLHPLGLCDLGGCCDSCWYRPDHPRFKKLSCERR
jgi:hypothetical protein